MTPIIDAHIHLYDPSRVQGVPWPKQSDALLYRPTLPHDYHMRTAPHTVVGAIVVEASPWVEDNQWVLDLAANNPFIRGLVGNLPAGTSDFAKNLEHYASNPLFRGIRVKQAQLQRDQNGPGFLADLDLLSSHDLTLDVLVRPTLLEKVAALAENLPGLRIIINHVANVTIDGRVADDRWQEGMTAAAAHTNVFCKVSALVEGTGQDRGTAPSDTEFYRSVLDTVWNEFGEDRLIFGSNWPVSERFAPFATVVGIVANYFSSKGANAMNNFLWRNAVAAYRIAERR